jgi:hypothetical protein
LCHIVHYACKDWTIKNRALKELPQQCVLVIYRRVCCPAEQQFLTKQGELQEQNVSISISDKLPEIEHKIKYHQKLFRR